MDLTPAWSIEPASEEPVARLAAEELRRTLRRLGGPHLPITSLALGQRIALRHGPEGDGFVRAPDAQGLLLRGDGPRGLLYAVYDLLEALGCRWVGPGPDGERLPRPGPVRLPTDAVADRPAIPRRGLIIGHDHFLAAAEGWVIWAARARLNTIFIHTISRGMALGACRLASWQRRRAALLPLIHERGLRLELGGHHLSDLVPRKLFRARPELFRHNGLRRTPDYNFCPSNPATRALLREQGTRFFQANPEAEVYHLWPDDILGGGWCSCPGCATLSPADQALMATNCLAEALAELRPDARLAYLAYHDTEAPPAQGTPHPQVELLFAPRPRSYAHGMGAPANAGYAARLAGNRALVERDDAHSRTAIFEYYLDGILFKSALPPLGATIAADMSHYSAKGVGTVHALMTGDRPWLAPQPNPYLFARLAWDPAQDTGRLLADYAAARAPHAPASLATAYMELETAWKAILDLDPAERMVRLELGAPRDVVGHPPADQLDVMAAPSPHADRRLERLRAAGAHLARGRAAWTDLLSTAFADGPSLAAERDEWECGALLLEFFTLRQQLYLLARRDAPRPRLTAALTEAQSALDTLLAWAERHVPPQARAGHLLLRGIFQLQLDHIYDARLARPWERATLRARRAAEVARRLARVLV